MASKLVWAAAPPPRPVVGPGTTVPATVPVRLHCRVGGPEKMGPEKMELALLLLLVLLQLLLWMSCWDATI